MAEDCTLGTFTAPLWAGKMPDLTTFSDRPGDFKGPSYTGGGEVKDPRGMSRAGRVLAASCFRGKHLSITLRDGQIGADTPKAPRYNPCPLDPDDLDRYQDAYEPDWRRNKDFLLTRAAVCKLLARILFGGARQVGLVLVSGATSSSKSEIARGLVKLYLDDRLLEVRNHATAEPASAVRRPHLVTVEQPIEKYRFLDPTKGPEGFEAPSDTQTKRGLDYTPREIGPDVEGLRSALMEDALRQTPSVVYVGELRNDEDLRTAIEFAATGHLIISTMHAGSLVESMNRLFEAMGVKTAQDRGMVSSRLCGLIHLRVLDVEAQSARVKALAPSLWRRTPQGVADMVTDGLSALLPHRVSASAMRRGDSDLPASMGRASLLEALCPRASPWRGAVIQKALEEDIQGI